MPGLQTYANTPSFAGQRINCVHEQIRKDLPKFADWRNQFGCVIKLLINLHITITQAVAIDIYEIRDHR